MTTLSTMYPPQANSPTTSTTGPMTDGSTTVTVLSASALPSAPTLLVLGGDTDHPETVLCTAITGDTLTLQRAVEGNAQTWAVGTQVARLFCAADLEAVQDNIEALNSGKAETSALPVAASFTPSMDGTGATGSSAQFARGDHVHPSDTSREAAGTADGVVGTHNTSASAHAALFADKQDVIDADHKLPAEYIEGLGNVWRLKGSKQYWSNLPSSGNQIGDVWYVEEDETSSGTTHYGQVGYVWLEDSLGDERWEQLGQTIDTSQFQLVINSSNLLLATYIGAGILAGKVQANATAEASNTEMQVRNITISTAEPTAAQGANGEIWIVYEG